MIPNSVYIAADFRNQAICRDYIRRAFEKEGVHVTSSWHFEEPALAVGSLPKDETRAPMIAEKNYKDVRDAQALVLYNPASMVRSGSGGRHVETGYMAGLGRPSFILGVKENVFHWHPLVEGVYALGDPQFVGTEDWMNQLSVAAKVISHKLRLGRNA